MLGLIYKLQAFMNQSYSQKDTFVILATYILENLENNKEFSLKSIADDCGISASSITRFAKELGYNGFLDLKSGILNVSLELKEMLIDLETPQATLTKQTYTNYKNERTNKIIKSIEGLAASNEMNFEYLNDLADKINECERIVFFATQAPANIIQITQHQFLTIGKNTKYYPLLKDQQEQSENLKATDLVFYISISGRYVSQKDVSINVLNSDAYKILVTQNQHIKLSQGFDKIVQLGNIDDEITGKYKLLLFFETLLQIYFNKYAR